jgi:hypothetical protein
MVLKGKEKGQVFIFLIGHGEGSGVYFSNYEYLENMPENEAVEMVYKYSNFFDVTGIEETSYLKAKRVG